MTVPLNPDGTPNYGAAAGTSGSGLADKSGMLSIWNIPAEIAKQEIWFDTGQRKAHTESIVQQGSVYSEQVPGGVQKPATKSLQAGASSYQILRNPVQIMKQFAALSANNPNEFIALQKALASGAWGTVHATGAFDPSTEKALGTAMLQYVKLSQGAGVGMNFTDYVLSTASRAAQLAQEANPVQQPVYQVSDPDQIRQAAQSAAQQALGMGLSGAQLSEFVTHFQNAQLAAQKTQSGTVTAPDLSSSAMQFAQGADPTAYHDNQRQSFIDSLVNMFAPSGSQRPNMTPVPKA